MNMTSLYSCSRWILAYQHIDPKEAVDIHNDIKCKTSIGIHWGTFPMGAKEFYLEPREKVKEELNHRHMEPVSFITVAHGEISTFNHWASRNNELNNWWTNLFGALFLMQYICLWYVYVRGFFSAFTSTLFICYNFMIHFANNSIS